MNSTDLILSVIYLIPVTKYPIEFGFKYVKFIFNLDLLNVYKFVGSNFLIFSNCGVSLINSSHFPANFLILLKVSNLY